jgi:hypothetical protein
LAEEPVYGVQSGRAGDRVVPRVPSRAATRGGAGGIGLQVLEDFVADLAFEGPQRFFGGLALGHLLVVVGPAVAVTLADLGDRGHVHGVAEAPGAAPGQPVNLAVAGGHLDRRGAVVSSEAVPAGEPAGVTGLADDDGGDDRSGAGDLGEGGP